MGFHVVDAKTGKAVGEIRSVDDSTINTLFELETIDGNDLLVPASDELISAVDTERQTITMELPEGLLEL